MTSGYSILQLKEDDALKILAAQLHIGSKDVDYQMNTYVWKKKPRNEGSSVINIRKFWEKLILAARAIVAIENPADVCAISCQPQGQRAVLKFAKYTGATAIAGRFTPGSFTNQIQAAFKEPRLIIITNPIVDHQAVSEASFVNIPANKSIGLMWWFLTREVLRLRGEINRQAPWDVMVDLFFYRDPEETEKEDQVGLTGQDRDTKQFASDFAYYDDGPSMMPAAESFAGNQENWGASATDSWAGTGTGAADTNEGNASNAANTIFNLYSYNYNYNYLLFYFKMHITEFRIVLPMAVEEYQAAQLFATIEVSKQNTGGGEGVQILANEPFQKSMAEAFLGKYNSGQYTRKIYHFGSRVPAFVRLIFKDSNLAMHEEAWNAYPYCKTVITNPYMKENMIIDISTLHLPDRGESENVHQLTGDELKKRHVVSINIAEKVNRHDYKPEEDPEKFHSEKTGRGPLLSSEPWYKSCEPHM
ncbi:unnamed protein product [Rotaria sp. Silwood2]|nr:unnamed protein product [Rotaria sp. Silwood2]CAF2532036.1 unnamed protein product [Rotaria sp. Silwood2]CAF2928474.1 unnamed protein product [Rotaria sp. Silwood2]CAF4176241.1 unnamed protein product [Rotaria sp. Silwood2]CAF4195780.1 unnamed protein product [Rotaria sp. Silwood2]